jgi:hypothetical protein
VEITDPWIIKSRQTIEFSKLAASWLGEAGENSLERMFRS